MRAVILGCAFLLTTPLFARENTDVVVMKNGDHLTGEIKGLSTGVLYLSMKYILGTSEIQWSEVARLESKQLFIVKTEDGAVHTGALSTLEASGKVLTIEVIEAPGKQVVIESPRIVTMESTSEKFFQRFNGAINLGSTYSKGNQQGQYSLGTQVNYPRERWAAALNYNSTLTTSSGSNPSTRNQLDVDAFHLLPPKNWFYEGLGGLLQSTEQSIDAQDTLGFGVGRFLKNTNRSRISVYGGVAQQTTNYTGSTNAQNLVSGLVVANLQFFRFNKTNGTLTASVLPAFNDPGRVKTNVSATYMLKFFGDFKWNLSFYGNWDNRPPSNFAGSDYGTTTGLSWTFGNK